MGRIRRCSFCNYSGHNKTTCEARKTAKKVYFEDRAEKRGRILNLMKKHGFGVGSIIKFEDTPMFVKEIIWNHIACYGYYHSVVVDILERQEECPWAIDLPKSCYPEQDYSYLGDKIDIINPVNPDTIENTIPDGWLDGTIGDLPMYLR